MTEPSYDLEYFQVTFPAEFVALVEINRPEKLNAFKDPMWSHLEQTFQTLSTDPRVRSIILTGAGTKAFTAGLDVAAAAAHDFPQDSPSNSAPDVARRAFRWRNQILHIQRTVSAIEACLKPVICAFHGYCYGAAIDIATACDVRFAAGNAKFSVKETAIGLAADVGTLSRLPKVVGRALEVAKEMARHSPVAVQGTKRIIDYSRDHSVRDGLEYTSVWNASMLQGDDMVKALESGLRKERPVFAKL